MPEHNCKLCDYMTFKKSSFDNHNKSKKHKYNLLELNSKLNVINKDNNTPKLNKPSLKNDIHLKNNSVTIPKNTNTNKDKDKDKLTDIIDELKPSICKYCKKQIAHVNNIRRHEKLCKHKETIELQKEKLELQLQLEQKTGELQQTTIQLDKLKEEQTDYHKLLKQIADSKHNKSAKTVNMYYILNNFTEALNYDELMSPPLTDAEKAILNELEPLAGSIKLIELRCITGLDVHKRPLHCLDTSRNKYMVRINNEWVVDHRAKKIFYNVAKHIHSHYLIDPDDERYNINQIIATQERVLHMEGKAGQLKLINDLNDKVSVKNIKLN